MTLLVEHVVRRSPELEASIEASTNTMEVPDALYSRLA